MLGSHDSLAYNREGKPKLSFISQTQYFDLKTQLSLGVRYLDIRMRHYKDAFVAHHGPTYLHSNFGDVVGDLCGFLTSEQGKRETVIIRLKRETGWWDLGLSNNQDWEATIFDYFHTPRFGTKPCLEKIWWQPATNAWPLLGAVRGKLIILEDFRSCEHGPYGIQRWDNADVMRTQDAWRVWDLGRRRKAKFESVVRFWWRYVDSGTGAVRQCAWGRLLINHVSGSGLFAWPVSVATGRKGLNSVVEKWLGGVEGKAPKMLGVVVVDFVAGGLGEVVVGRNFEVGEPGESR
ncbi:MAG: hypothetical protein M1839_005246 [Geoglossum umbratile]|nr:MAG: hypothetical protein M1839_005246 [Geoglossum umbratile]